MTHNPDGEDGLRILWACLERPAPLLDHAVFASIPARTRQYLLASGVIVETTAADHAPCPNCPDRHVEAVEYRAAADGTPRYYIRCPQSLRVEVDGASLRQWTIAPEVVAALVASAMSLRGRVKALRDGRVWRLGTTDWLGTSREILLARGLDWEDGREAAAGIGAGGRGIVLVADRPPPPEFWPGRRPAVVPLSRIATLRASSAATSCVELDLKHFVALVREADDAAQAAQVLPLDVRARNLIVRRHVKEELAAMLDDDALVAAFTVHGSYRSAAAALSRQRGIPVTKDKIARAVHRKGGPAAVPAARDSSSVTRSVASHRRDKGRRILSNRNSPLPE